MVRGAAEAEGKDEGKGGGIMRILKPGDMCPCCGQSLKSGLPTETVMFLSWIAEGMALWQAVRSWRGNKVMTDA